MNKGKDTDLWFVVIMCICIALFLFSALMAHWREQQLSIYLN